VVEVRRAAKAGADIVFISPVFATPSHPGAKGLGVVRWNNLARYRGRALAYALGGIDGQKINALARSCCGAGGVSSFL
jgi:thiamine-phosphate pyrophosphorylase